MFQYLIVFDLSFVLVQRAEVIGRESRLLGTDIILRSVYIKEGQSGI